MVNNVFACLYMRVQERKVRGWQASVICVLKSISCCRTSGIWLAVESRWSISRLFIGAVIKERDGEKQASLHKHSRQHSSK